MANRELTYETVQIVNDGPGYGYIQQIKLPQGQFYWGQHVRVVIEGIEKYSPMPAKVSLADRLADIDKRFERIEEELKKRTPSETGWLIELHQCYSEGYHPRWVESLEGNGQRCLVVNFTTEASKALRFARKVDAEKILDRMLIKDKTFVCEHSWG